MATTSSTETAFCFHPAFGCYTWHRAGSLCRGSCACAGSEPALGQLTGSFGSQLQEAPEQPQWHCWDMLAPWSGQQPRPRWEHVGTCQEQWG